MVKRKAGALLASEVQLLCALDGGASYAYEIARVLDRPYRTVGHALRRLEDRGLAKERWDTTARPEEHGGPPRRVYSLTARGRRALAQAETPEP